MAERKAWDWESLGQDIGTWERPSGAVEQFVSSVTSLGAIRVWDLGCGIGRHTALLARSGCQVYATDLSSSGARMTENRLRSEGLKAMVCVADMVAAPLASGRFDAVLAFNVIYHGTRRDVVSSVAEISRVLRSRGLALITFQSTRSSKFGSGRPVDKNTFVAVGGHEDGIPHFFADGNDVRDLVGADFSILELRHDEEPVPGASEKDRNCHWIACVRRK
ncbi:MAG: class I SAM-dependent methyltransferase [Gammaproteobacteria bacterium]|jgi:SAM-dependent methyltransferase|nr:class I SAM-dependent methyltransferase [Gammaproteobacteria bacterium]